MLDQQNNKLLDNVAQILKYLNINRQQNAINYYRIWKLVAL
jgi:hypothetical protein